MNNGQSLTTKENETGNSSSTFILIDIFRRIMMGKQVINAHKAEYIFWFKESTKGPFQKVEFNL